jgi:hypothetical protein
MSTKSITRCMILALVMVFMTSGIAFAGVQLAIGPTYASPLTVGQTYTVHVSVRNTSTTPEGDSPNTVSLFWITTDINPTPYGDSPGFSHNPSCDDFGVPCSIDENALTLGATAIGRDNSFCVGASNPYNCCTGAGTGTCGACAGRTFDITPAGVLNISASGPTGFTDGTYIFEPQDGNPIVLSSPGNAGDSCAVDFEATVVSLADGSTNQPTTTIGVSSLTGQDVPQTGNGIVELVGVPDCSVEKSVTPELSKVGDNVTYHLGEFCNTGDTVLVDASCSDTVTGDCTAEIAHCFPLAPGECCDGVGVPFADVPYTIQPGDSDPLVNVITVDCEDEIGQTASCENTATVNLFQPSVTCSKEVDADVSKVGHAIHYTITLNNTSSDDTPVLHCTKTDSLLGIDTTFDLASGQSDVEEVDYVIQPDDPDPLVNTAQWLCNPDGFENPIIPPPDGTCSVETDLVQFDATLSKSCSPTTVSGDGGTLTWNIERCNTSPDDIDLEICVNDADLGIVGDCLILGQGQCDTITVDQTIDQCPDTTAVSDTATATAQIVDPDYPDLDNTKNLEDSDSCGVSCPSACRMTGGHVNMAGSIDAGFDDDSGTHYTTGGQIGAPRERGCPDSPWKGICDDGTCYGGLANGEPCESNSNCPNDSGHNSTRPWGDWEHNHHGGPDDGYISGGSFSFHSGTAAAPDEAFISNIICTDKGWCVQARPAPDKQIYWEGIGVFHNLKGADPGNEDLPDFPGCDVQVWDKKTGGTLHYYRAHVGDFGEPAGQRQKAACEGGECLGNWAIAGCNAVTDDCRINAEDNAEKTALHPLCLAQDCPECADWYDIEIHCTTDPASPVIYRVAHYILEGNFQLHPPVGESCNFSCNGVCETGELGYEEMCDPYCDYGDCCVPDGVTIIQ